MQATYSCNSVFLATMTDTRRREVHGCMLGGSDRTFRGERKQVVRIFGNCKKQDRRDAEETDSVRDLLDGRRQLIEFSFRKEGCRWLQMHLHHGLTTKVVLPI